LRAPVTVTFSSALHGGAVAVDGFQTFVADFDPAVVLDQLLHIALGAEVDPFRPVFIFKL
jgi:hypothetical protein